MRSFDNLRRCSSSVTEEDFELLLDASLPFDQFAGKTILVTGAAGFLPAYLVQFLLHLNQTRSLKLRVLGLVRNWEAAISKFSSYRDRNDFALLSDDLDQALAVDGAVDYIVHAASLASPKFYGADPIGTLKPNVFGTRNLLDLAVAKRTSGFLFFSSSEVYGQVVGNDCLIRETSYGEVDPLAVRSCYAESKRMGEAICAAWTRQHGVRTVVVRPFHTYGPGMRLDDGRVFSDFVRNLVDGNDIMVKSSGQAVRAYCYLRDATEGFLTALLKGEAGEAYNVGNPQMSVSVLELANRLTALYPEKGIRVVRDDQREDAYLKSPADRVCPDVTKMRVLGWVPKVGIEEGFWRTAESFRRTT